MQSAPPAQFWQRLAERTRLVHQRPRPAATVPAPPVPASYQPPKRPVPRLELLPFAPSSETVTSFTYLERDRGKKSKGETEGEEEGRNYRKKRREGEGEEERKGRNRPVEEAGTSPWGLACMSRVTCKLPAQARPLAQYWTYSEPQQGSAMTMWLSIQEKQVGL